MKREIQGQSSVEFLLVASVVAVCLFTPFSNGTSVSEQLIAAFTGNQQRYVESLTGTR